MNFEEWMAKVDQVLADEVGLTSDDLPDWHWADAHADGFTPHQAVNEYMEEVYDDN